MDPTLDGSYVFGTACKVQHVPHPVAVQKDAFFGINGVVALAGGSRGRSFRVEGLLIGDTPADVMAAETALLSYADGIARTFVDTQGRSWPNVIFEGQYQPSPGGPRPANVGWALPYVCMLTGLS